jgi:hypothetical protein
VPDTRVPVLGSIRMSERFRPSSTTYGPSVSSGFATQSAVPPVAAATVGVLVPVPAYETPMPAALRPRPAAPSRVSALRRLSPPAAENPCKIVI